MKGLVLVVEDDPGMLAVTRHLLLRSGYQVEAVSSAEEALAACRRRVPDAVVSDIQLPGMSGIKLVEILRADPAAGAVPVLLLTVMKKDADKVSGLRSGADDYLTKPYAPEELLARVEALIRRSRISGERQEVLRAGSLVLDVEKREARHKDRVLPLRRKEFALLEVLLRHKGRLVPREKLLRALWDGEEVVTENTLNVHVRNLRERLGPAGEALKTLIGEGYRLDDPD